MVLKTSLKLVFKTLLGLSGLFLVYSLIPRVFHHKSRYGKELARSKLISDKATNEIRSFIQDTANRMQVVMVLKNNEIIFEEGNTHKLINCHSARKSIMSLLYGIANERGFLNLNETLGELGIDESKTPLSEVEKTASIRDLIMARSGIYLKAEAEVDFAKNNRPRRGQYQAGEFFFYNNFDFNVLGAILEHKTGMSIGEFMERYLAKPLEFQDYAPSNVVYGSPWPVPNKTESDFPVYWIYLSARDFARIGILITQNGKWNDHQIVSESWMEQSFSDLTDFSDDLSKVYYPYDAFAYSWWINKKNQTIWADGYGGQFMCIDRKNKLVVLQRNFTGNSLLTSGLFLINKERDNTPKRDLIHIYDVILNHTANTD